MMVEEKNPYADIIHLPHHTAVNRPHMSLYDRAAQFAPFAALTGFDGVIAETGRLTENRVELSENEKESMERKLTRISDAVQAGQRPEIRIVYFVADALKEGGAYHEFKGRVRKIDTVEQCIVFLAANGRSAGKKVQINDILAIDGEMVEEME